MSANAPKRTSDKGLICIINAAHKDKECGEDDKKTI